MAGTSKDAIDAVSVAKDGTGLQMQTSVQRCATQPLGPLAAPLRQLASLEPMSARCIAKLAREG